ncbi:MAG: tail fiber domain-containing protein [Dyadobacter fermentans]
MKNGSLMLFRGTIYLIVKHRWFYASLGKMLFAVVFLLGVAVSAAFAQSYNSFGFQGVARDANGKIISNSTILLRFSIHKDNETGEVVFSEEKGADTNSFGFFDTSFGTGGAAAGLDWEHGNLFLQTEIATNLTNPLSFVDVGTTKLRSVPYALYSIETKKLSNYNPMVLLGDPLKGDIFPTVGTGSRLIWHPKKAAFRVGYVSNDFWENPQIGENSFAAGKDTWAGGNAAIALGLGTIAKVGNSISLGSYNDNSDPVSNDDYDRLFQIGNGINNANRSNALTILKNGRMGIGANSKSPQFMLDVDSRVRIKHSNQTAGINFNNSSNVPEGFVGMANDNEIGFYSGGKWLLVANKNGTVYMDSYYLTSDKRLKTDFKNLSGSLAKLSHLQGYSYRWLDTTRTQTLQTGLIAQEVEKLFPELVNTDDKGYKSMNYNGLIPHLIEAVKELKGQTAEMAELRQELNELKMLTGQKGANGTTPGSVKSK